MNKKIIKNIIVYSILILGIFFVVYPFFYMVMNSFKTGPEIMHKPNSLPKQITFKGYKGVFQSLNIGRLFFNSIFVAGSITGLNTIFSSMVAYGILKTGIKHKKMLVNIILSSMMIPSVLLLIPTYMMVYNWGWVDTYRVLIIPGMMSAYNVFLMIQFMKQIDDAYLEAARIDGAHELKIFWSIVLPMARPALATLIILTFMGSWNDFFGPLLYIRDEAKMTLQLALYKFQGSVPGKNLEQIWAATTLITLPVTILFFFTQKNFIKAFTGVGIK